MSWYIYALATALLSTASATDTLPYNPTRVLFPSNGSYAYILDTTTQQNGSARLLSLDLDQEIDTSNFNSIATVSDIPWTSIQDAVNAFQDANGDIVVLTGNCTTGAGSTQVWRYGTNESAKGNGTWTQEDVTGEQGVNYLAAGMAYSGQSSGTNSSLYLFAGMCPDSGSTASNWTSEATYSASMLELVSSNDEADTSQYTESVTVSSDGPVAEAGFTITTLPATTMHQQFVLVGGHTESAFINMSQVAIYSLPQESWTFLPITQQNTTEVEPRSGHTAVLTEDGSKIIVLGGWVGDTSSPASPQMAILDIGTGYGGTGQWQWTIPSTTGTGLSANTGIFGHGAAILPGNIMLVYGGYSIPASSSKFRKRAGLTAQTQALMFNVSSNTWITTYDAPASSTSQSTGSTTAASTTASANTSGEKIGLAVGLTIGLLILLALIIFYFWYTRRSKRRRLEAERSLMSRSSEESYTHASEPFLEKNSMDGRGGDITSFQPSWMAATGAGQSMDESSASTGLFMDVPSPTRGLRKGVPQPRNYQYHAAPRYDDKRVSRGSGGIHPIAEIDDEDGHRRSESDVVYTEAQRQLKEVERILQGNRNPDRFKEAPNPLRSHPVSPETGQDNAGFRVREELPVRTGSPNWTREPSIHRTGRISPTKTDDRTSSTLSDRSHLSAYSDHSITRTMSTRTGALLAAAAAAHVRAKAVEVEASSSSEGHYGTTSTTGRISPIKGIARSSTNGSSVGTEPRSAGADAESFRTAHSHTAGSQHEREALLDFPTVDYDDPYRRALTAGGSQHATTQSLQFGPTRRRQGILGSLRRAIGAMSVGERSMSLMSGRAAYGAEQMSSTNSSPTKDRQSYIDGAPRRTVSDGGALFRPKRGRQDWADNAWPPYHDDPDPGDWGEPLRTSMERLQAEEEWDIENAAAKRDVQIMFTVPKSRLRVVNADMDRASLRSVSDGALSRNNSGRAHRYEEPRSMLRMRSDMDREKLSSMLEVESEDKDKKS